MAPKKRKSKEDASMSAPAEDKPMESKKKPEPKKSELKVSYEAWFAKKRAAKEPKLKPWYREAIWLFMKKQGLSKWEEEKKYDAAFKRY